ncbi:hypothetical protein GPJ56_006838 [Histomonas meleagridis]|uniref:uncharacterized protein n=1 Tax=Histomonas meleagridis TaxID=135588 RepID=UPI003559F9BC|nr:hypothetical protein GPJ56_006838 [Histomonas meleagridis]KAH0800245.1 hypothetical protein GO595_007357 [Histomonas meleagridis]
MSGKPKDPNRKRRGRPPKNHNRNPPKQATPKVELPKQDAPKITISIEHPKDPLRIVLPNGNEATPTTKPQTQPQQPVLQITRPTSTKCVLSVSPEAAQHMLERKAEHTYTIKQMRAKRHTHELASQSVFRFHAELQLYKRYISGGAHRKKVNSQKANIAVLQQRINNILLQFNVNTFHITFNQILSLGIESDTFVLSFVNVVFKQAALNPSLALLFSVLSANVMYVLKRTKYANMLRNLFQERCKESFAVPKNDTDKGTFFLLRGVVVFAGHLFRDGIIQMSLLSQFANELIKSKEPKSVQLLISLFIHGGTNLIEQNKEILTTLSKRMEEIHDEEIINEYNELCEMTKTGLKENEQSERELKHPEMQHSPSIDQDLDMKYPSLFKHSESIPAQLSALSGEEEDDKTMESIVGGYLYSSNPDEFAVKIEKIGYHKNDQKTAVDLIRAVAKQPEQNQLVVSELVLSMRNAGYFDDTMLKNAIKIVSKEFANEVAPAIALGRIYAILVNEEITTFDDFVDLFGDMKGIWKSVIPSIFTFVDQICGSWFDNMMESQFWRDLDFIDAKTFEEKLDKMKEWDIADVYPHYDAANGFIQLVKEGKDPSDYISKLDQTVSRDELTKLIIQQMEALDDKEIDNVVTKMKEFFRAEKEIIESMATKSKVAAKVSQLLQ